MNKIFIDTTPLGWHRFVISMMLVCTLVTANQAIAQTRGVSKEMEELFALENHNANLTVTVLMLQGESTSVSRNRFSSEEVLLLEQAVYTVPYVDRFFEIWESACDYFYSTTYQELDATMLGRARADAQWAEIEDRVAFLEASISGLSIANRERAFRLMSSNVGKDAVSVSLHDHIQEAEVSPELAKSRFNSTCERLPDIKARYGPDGYIYGESVMSFESFENRIE